MQALRRDRHADPEVVRGAGEIAAAFVAAPVEQHSRGFTPRGIARRIRGTGREDVVFLHRRADRDVCGFVAEARGIRAELAGALQATALLSNTRTNSICRNNGDEFAPRARSRAGRRGRACRRRRGTAGIRFRMWRRWASGPRCDAACDAGASRAKRVGRTSLETVRKTPPHPQGGGQHGAGLHLPARNAITA
jgi:hypothetical protein